ncbi:MAG: hypothetical protein CMJ78_07490 [Planctomycetaceae bacterium]|nr:hypothetical protein [Planctomycetaceae bacterium]
MKTLTPRQREIYDYIRERIEADGFPPAVREIGEVFGITSPNGVMTHLKALEKKGLIERDSHAARAIRLVDAPATSAAPDKLLDGSLLTKRQREIFEYICSCTDKNGFSPTVREIDDEFGIRSPNGVATHLKALEKKGFIDRRGSSARGLRVLGRLATEQSVSTASSVPATASTKEPTTEVTEPVTQPPTDGILDTADSSAGGQPAVAPLDEYEIGELSQQAEQIATSKQAISRVVKAFFIRHKNSASVFEVELLLTRLSKEVESLGDDGDKLHESLRRLGEEVRKLRSAKQERLVGEAWKSWQRWIEQIRKNPLGGCSLDDTDEPVEESPEPQPAKTVQDGGKKESKTPPAA